MTRFVRRALPLYALLHLVSPMLVSPVLWAQAPAAASQVLLKSGTPVELRLAQTISSSYAHPGDRLQFTVVKNVEVSGFTVVRRGTPAAGTVIQVRRRRRLGLGGSLTIRLDSVPLAGGGGADLDWRRQFKGTSHTVRMGLGMALAGAIYWPLAPALLLARGNESVILAGTTVTAHTHGDFLFDPQSLRPSPKAGAELSEMIDLWPSRVSDGEGLEGDMVNLVFLARQEDLQKAFERAGWLGTDRSVPRIVWHLLRRRTHYKNLPMERLYAFGRTQDYSYALPDPQFIVARRHHIRIWKTEREIGGVPLWVGAATHDVSIAFILHKFEIFHRIDPNVDEERDFIAGNLAQAWQPAHREYINAASSALSASTANGQSYYSDGRILFVDLNRNDAPSAATAKVAAIAQ